jgi:hypothetical protein
MGLFDRFRKNRSSSSPSTPVEAPAIAPAEWRKEFDERREAFIRSLRDAVAGCEAIESRVFDEEGYTPFTEWVDKQIVKHDRGGLREAEAFLRHLIDEGHVVAFAVSREGTRASVCVSYDADQDDWTPVWPEGFRVDISRTSSPMTREW